MKKTKPKKTMCKNPDPPRTHTIDGRTRQARSIKEIKEGLEQNPVAMAKALLTNLVAQNATIAQEVFNAALNSGDLLDSKGRLIPIVDKTYHRFQAASKAALADLLKIDGTAKPGAGDPDAIFEDVFNE